MCEDVVVIMQEFAPSDEEFAALRAGEEWDPEKARLKAEKVCDLNSVWKQKYGI